MMTEEDLAPLLPDPGHWVSLDDRAVFLLRGPDRVRYLNGQVSNDVSRDLSSRTIAGCLCGVKGRVEALVWITEWDDGLLIDGEGKQRDFLLARLEKYLIADDCEFTDLTGQLRLRHCFGEGETGGTRLSYRFGVAGQDVWSAPDESGDLDPGREWPAESLARLSILSRLPESETEITGSEFPSELGLDQWAVDFHKGCYLGQEVISRIESVGRTRRSLEVVRGRSLPGTGAECALEMSQKFRVGRMGRKAPDGSNGEEWGLILAGESNKAKHENHTISHAAIVQTPPKRPR